MVIRWRECVGHFGGYDTCAWCEQHCPLLPLHVDAEHVRVIRWLLKCSSMFARIRAERARVVYGLHRARRPTNVRRR